MELGETYVEKKCSNCLIPVSKWVAGWACAPVLCRDYGESLGWMTFILKFKIDGYC